MESLPSYFDCIVLAPANAMSPPIKYGSVSTSLLSFENTINIMQIIIAILPSKAMWIGYTN